MENFTLEPQTEESFNKEEDQRIEKFFARKNRTPLANTIKFDLKSHSFKGYAIGLHPICDVSEYYKGYLITAVQNSAIAVLDEFYSDDLASMFKADCYRAFVERLANMKSYECPFTLLSCFTASIQQDDFTDWRRRKNTIRTINQRNRRIERGEISGKVRTPRATKPEVEYCATHGVDRMDCGVYGYVEDSIFDDIEDYEVTQSSGELKALEDLPKAFVRTTLEDISATCRSNTH